MEKLITEEEKHGFFSECQEFSQEILIFCEKNSKSHSKCSFSLLMASIAFAVDADFPKEKYLDTLHQLWNDMKTAKKEEESND